MKEILNESIEELLRQNQLLKEENRELKSKMLGFSVANNPEYNFKPVADTLPIILWFISPEGKIIFYNRKWKNYTGLPADQWRKALHKEDKRKAIAGWGRALRHGTFLETEARLLRSADDIYRWHLIRIHPQRNEDGTIIRWIGTAIDIEDHMRLLKKQSLQSQQLEERIKIRTAQLNEAQSIAHVGSWEWELACKEVSWSDEMYRIFGLEPGEIAVTEEIYFSFIHPEAREKVKETIQAAIENNKPYRFTHRIIRKDGEIRTLECRGRLVCDAQGKVIKLTGTGQDITKLIEKENKLREAKELSENIIAHSVDGINVFDKDMRYLVWNETLAGFTGIAPEDAIGKKIFEVFPSAVGSEYAEIFEKVLQGEKSYLAERPFFNMNGFYESHSIPMRNMEGEVIGGINIVHDITERKQAEEKLLEKNNELVRSNQELEQFAYIVSHDLKEPLRMVSSYMQMLRKKYSDKFEGQAEEYMNFAVDGAQRMSILINDLLEYSRIGRLNTATQIVDCNDILEIVKKNLQTEIEKTQAIFTIGNLPVIKSSFTYMVQVFQNLAGNALKFRSNRKPEIEITAVRAENNFWKFSIKDNGIGMEAQHLERIFIIFQRLHTREEYSGTGIGLAISKKIVEFHGGNIWVESKPGEGTTFYFTLPGK